MDEKTIVDSFDFDSSSSEKNAHEANEYIKVGEKCHNSRNHKWKS